MKISARKFYKQRTTEGKEQKEPPTKLKSVAIVKDSEHSGKIPVSAY